MKSVVFDLLDSDGDGLISVEVGLPSCASKQATYVGLEAGQDSYTDSQSL